MHCFVSNHVPKLSIFNAARQNLIRSSTTRYGVAPFLNQNKTLQVPGELNTGRFIFQAHALHTHLNRYGVAITAQKIKNKQHVMRTIIRNQVSKPKSKQSTNIVESETKPFGELTTGQKVKQAGKDATYTGIVIVGLGVTGLMFLAIGRELFSGQSPSGVYGKAFKRCKQNDEIYVALGTPIKAYGEMTRRGRRRHVAHTKFMVNDVEHMRMKFYIEGPENKGTVHLEVKKNESGKYEFRYLFAELETFPPRTVILEDNR